MYIVIAGGGAVGQSLTRILVAQRHDVVVVEKDRAVCETLSARTGALVRLGNATDIEVLEEAGMDHAEIAVAVMPSDADNLAFAVLARHFGVPRIMARMRDPKYEAAYESAGVTKVLHIVELFVNQLALEIEQPQLRQVASLGGGKASITIAVVPEKSVVHGKTIAEIAQDEAFPKACVIAGIYREESEEFIIPRGMREIRSGDKLFLAADTNNISRAANYLQKTKR
ncbi:MAG: TrkA family potassium uptake protein [Planctomycetota bacterium]